MDIEEETIAEGNLSIDSDKKEDIPAEHVSSEETEQPAADGKSPVEAENTSEPEENSEKEFPAARDDNTSPDVPVNLKEDDDDEHEKSVVSEESFTADLDTLTREAVSLALKEEEGGDEVTQLVSPEAEKKDDRYESYVQMLQELQEGMAKASQCNRQLQTKVADYLRKKAGEDGRSERERSNTVMQQEFEKYMKNLLDLKQQIVCESEESQMQEEQLKVQIEEKMREVNNEWRALVKLKRDMAVGALSRRLGKEAARTRVDSALAAEQLHQDQLTKLRLAHIKLQREIRRLDVVLRGEEKEGTDHRLVLFEQQQLARLEQKIQAEKQSEECAKLQGKITSYLEKVTNMKEKLQESQLDVQALRGQLAELEVTLARKRAILIRTKQAQRSLQKDNQRLKEQSGLLGNTVLLQDFEDTVDASESLEEQLGNLMSQQAEIGHSCSRWKKHSQTTEQTDESS